MVRKIAIQGNFVTPAETKPQIFRGKIVSHTNYEPSTPEAYPISGRRDFRKVVPAVGRYECLAWGGGRGAHRLLVPAVTSNPSELLVSAKLLRLSLAVTH